MPRASVFGTTSSRAYARMATKQQALDAVTRIVADGMFEAARTIVETASERAPDYPFPTKKFPFGEGEGLPKQGGVLVYVGGEKTHGWSIRGSQPKKPRAIRTAVKEHSVLALAGFGFPARFVELGTVRTRAQPFLAPARDAVAPFVADIVGRITRPKLGSR